MGVVKTSYVCTLIVLIIIIVNLPYIFIVDCFVLPLTDHWQGEAVECWLSLQLWNQLDRTL